MVDTHSPHAASAEADRLDTAELVEVYRDMTLGRALDERIWMLNRQGKAAIVASMQGHEAAQLASVRALRKDSDLFYVYYRDLAVMLSLGFPRPRSCSASSPRRASRSAARASSPATAPTPPAASTTSPTSSAPASRRP